MSETVNKSIRTKNFKIKSRKETSHLKENFGIELPFSLMAEFSSMRSVGYLNRNMNEKQKLAITRLKTHLRQIFLNKFNRMMCMRTFYKSTEAYRVHMICTKKCNFSCSIIFNIKSKKVSVLDNGAICDHFVDSNGKIF